MDDLSMWDPPVVGRDPGPFAVAAADAIADAGERIDPLRAQILLALAREADALGDWLARRPEAKPAERVALARLLQQLGDTFERSAGPVAARDDGGLAALLSEFGNAAGRDAAGPALAQ